MAEAVARDLRTGMVVWKIPSPAKDDQKRDLKASRRSGSQISEVFRKRLRGEASATLRAKTRQSLLEASQ